MKITLTMRKRHLERSMLGRVVSVPGVLAILGLLTFFTGFGIFGYVVLSFLMQIFSAISSPSNVEPDLSAVPFQLIPIGVGLAFVGMLLASLAGSRLLRRGKRSRC